MLFDLIGKECQHSTPPGEQEQVHIIVSTIGSALPLHVAAGDSLYRNQYRSKCLMIKSTCFVKRHERCGASTGLVNVCFNVCWTSL